MEEINLSAIATSTTKITNDLQALILENVSPVAEITADLVRDGSDELRMINKLKVGTVIEFQDKIQKLRGYDVARVMKSVLDHNDDSIEVYDIASLELGFDGEIKLGDDDHVMIKFENLGNVKENSSYQEFQGLKEQTILFDFVEHTFNSQKRDKTVNLPTAKFLVFPDVLPEKINCFKGSEMIQHTSTTLKMLNVELFGVVQFQSDGTPVAGSKYCTLLPVSQFDRVRLIDDVQEQSFKFYTVDLTI